MGYRLSKSSPPIGMEFGAFTPPVDFEKSMNRLICSFFFLLARSGFSSIALPAKSSRVALSSIRVCECKWAWLAETSLSDALVVELGRQSAFPVLQRMHMGSDC